MPAFCSVVCFDFSGQGAPQVRARQPRWALPDRPRSGGLLEPWGCRARPLRALRARRQLGGSSGLWGRHTGTQILAHQDLGPRTDPRVASPLLTCEMDRLKGAPGRQDPVGLPTWGWEPLRLPQQLGLVSLLRILWRLRGWREGGHQGPGDRRSCDWFTLRRETEAPDGGHSRPQAAPRQGDPVPQNLRRNPRAWLPRAEPVAGKGCGLEGRMDSAQRSRTLPVGNMRGCPCDWMGTRAGVPSSVGVTGSLGPPALIMPLCFHCSQQRLQTPCPAPGSCGQSRLTSRLLALPIPFPLLGILAFAPLASSSSFLPQGPRWPCPASHTGPPLLSPPLHPLLGL